MHRYKIVDDGTGRLNAVDGYKKGEILASWDERFRPVNLLGGSRRHASTSSTCIAASCRKRIYWTDYLRDYIKARDLEQPVNLGRIWRIVHDTTKRDAEAGAVEGARRRSWCRRFRIRTAGGATRRSSCWCSAATSRSCRS